jgi:hypothetical protein
MGKVTKTIASKLIWAVLGFAVLYLAASAFNLVPQSMKDTVAWFGANITLFVVAICFLVACYVVLKIKTRHREAY